MAKHLQTSRRTNTKVQRYTPQPLHEIHHRNHSFFCKHPEASMSNREKRYERRIEKEVNRQASSEIVANTLVFSMVSALAFGPCGVAAVAATTFLGSLATTDHKKIEEEVRIADAMYS